MPLENTTNFAWVSIDSLLLASSSSGEKRDWDGNEGTKGKESTDKQKPLCQWSDGMDKGGGREAHQAVVDLVCWLVGADTGYSCWFKKRGTDEQCT